MRQPLVILVASLLWVVCVSSKATLKQPIKGVYVNWESINWAAPEENILNTYAAGFNLIVITSFNGNESAELAEAWEEGLTDTVKQSTMQQAHDNGAQVLVQLILQSDDEFSENATIIGQKTAAFVQNNYLDGVEIYLLNIGPGFSAGGVLVGQQLVQWVIELHVAIRNVLGPDGVITHSPYAAYFGPAGTDDSTLPGVTGGYTSINTQLHDSIDYFNIFYFNTFSCYTDYTSLFIHASCQPHTSVSEIHAESAVPLTKMIIVKPRDVKYTSAPQDGYVSADDLHSFVTQAARSIEWDTGVGLWVFDTDGVVTQFMSTVFEEELPSPPTSPLLLNELGLTVTLGWNASFYNGNSPITAYILRRNSNVVYNGLAMTYVDFGLSAATTYTYTITAENSKGESNTSVSISVTTQDVPVPPTSLMQITYNTTSITLQWSASIATDNRPVVGYMLYRDGMGVYTGTATMYDDFGLQPGSNHQYTLVAYNAVGNSIPSDPVSVSTKPTVPGAPSILSVKAVVSSDSIYMSWVVVANGGANITSYRLHNPVYNEDLYTGTQPFYTDTGLLPNSTYYYAVAATNVAGEGPFSATVSFNTLPDNFVTVSQNIALNSILGGITGLCAVVCIAFVVLLVLRKDEFREKSPLLCGFIMAGVLVSYLAALIALLEPTDGLCVAFPWMLGLAFTLVFGCLFLKTWRLWRILQAAKHLKRQAITNMYVLKLLSIYFGIECIYLIIWTCIDIPKAQYVTLYDGKTKQMQCICPNYGIVMWIVFLAYKILWMFFGAFMAFKSKGIFREFKESRQIAFSIYNCMAVGVVAFPLGLLLNNIASATVIIIIVAIMMVFTATLLALFGRIGLKILSKNDEDDKINIRMQKIPSSARGVSAAGDVGEEGDSPQ